MPAKQHILATSLLLIFGLSFAQLSHHTTINCFHHSPQCNKPFSLECSSMHSNWSSIECPTFCEIFKKHNIWLNKAPIIHFICCIQSLTIVLNSNPEKWREEQRKWAKEEWRKRKRFRILDDTYLVYCSDAICPNNGNMFILVVEVLQRLSVWQMPFQSTEKEGEME